MCTTVEHVFERVKSLFERVFVRRGVVGKHAARTLRGVATGRSAAVSSVGAGTLDVFYRNAADGLSRRRFDGSSGGWGPTQDAGNFNSPAGSEPAVATLSTGLPLVFMRGTIGGLWVRVYT